MIVIIFIVQPLDPPSNINAEAVQVIGKPEISIEKNGVIKIIGIKPITADIDILAYGERNLI